MENNKRVTIHITSRDRVTEVCLLLQSLRTQTFKDWDVIIFDDGSGTPHVNSHFFSMLINRIKMEGHYVKILRNDINMGTCKARNRLIDEDNLGNSHVLRLDDDVILEPDYIERLLKVIDMGYDMASGIVPLLGYPEIERESRFVKGIINEVKFNEDGTFNMGDDCGYSYYEPKVYPAHHFRTNCLYKSEINKKVKYESGLTQNVAFREESFFSMRCMWLGYKMAVDTGAKAYHLQTPSGGVRVANYNECVAIDDLHFREWMKRQYLKKGDFKNAKREI